MARVHLFHTVDSEGFPVDFIGERAVSDPEVDTFAEAYAREHGIPVRVSTEEGRPLETVYPNGDSDYLGY